VVYAVAQRPADPDAPLYTAQDTLALLERSGGISFADGFAAFRGGEMVGELFVTGSRVDNLHRAMAWAWVPPRFGRQGIGSALMEYAERHVRGLDRTVLGTETLIGPDGRHGYRRFVERLGYTLANTQVERHRSLPVDPALLDRLAAQAAPHHTAYDIETFTGPVPARWAPGYCELINRINLDMPTGEMVLEEGRRTPADLAAQDADIAASHRTRVTALALTPAGAVVGLTTAVATPPGSHHVDQWATIVDPRHRGHRLGLAIKVAHLRAMVAAFPDKTVVDTSNAETNAPMVAVNEALGFEVHRVTGEFEKQLAPTS
jgi:GNAT superfamily N-acetyltransferase